MNVLVKCCVIIWLTVCIAVLCEGRGWTACTSSCAKAPAQCAKRWDVVPLGYPYGFDWIGGGPYLGPYAGPTRAQFGWPWTFGYQSLWGSGATC